MQHGQGQNVAGRVHRGIEHDADGRFGGTWELHVR
jgi:hypothetical protein